MEEIILGGDSFARDQENHQEKVEGHICLGETGDSQKRKIAGHGRGQKFRPPDFPQKKKNSSGDIVPSVCCGSILGPEGQGSNPISKLDCGFQIPNKILCCFMKCSTVL